MAKHTIRPDVFQFGDYRSFLKEIFLHNKNKNKKFSHQYVARKMKVSPSYFKHVFEKRRNISIDRISDVADIFRLEEAELEYFTVLVIRDLTEDRRTRQYLSAVLNGIAYRKNINPRPVATPAVDILIEDWLAAAIFEMPRIQGFRPDANWVHAKLSDSDSISIERVREAIAELREAGLFPKDEDGGASVRSVVQTSGNPFQPSSFKQCRGFVSKVFDILGDAAKYQPCTIYQAIVPVNDEVIQLLREKHKAFVDAVCKVDHESKDTDQLLMVSTGFFSLLKSEEGG